MTAQEAARTLGVRVETVYAYVSRGLIRSEPAGNQQSRQRRYFVSDIKSLQQRQAQRSDPARATLDALHFGTPVLESSITLIADGQLYYRGRSAVALAEGATFEEVAGLIWQGTLQDPFAEGVTDLATPYMMGGELAHLPILLAFQSVLPQAGASDRGAYDLRPAGVRRTGVRIMRLLARLTAGQSADLSQPLARLLATGWGHIRPQAAALINAALILCADHELNASSFTARCVAATRANPYAVVQAGLSALQGPRHGGHTERVAVQFREIGEPENALAALSARLRRGDAIEGFGHKLYPEGDPRATYLLQRIGAAFPDAPMVRLVEATVAAAAELIEERPTLDVSLVLMEHVLGLPAGSALALFALGRTVGWLGHAMETYASSPLIRPRARYVGILPQD